MTRFALVYAVIGFLAVQGCGSPTTPDDEERVGVVEFLDIEGGCWSIKSGAETFDPINLPEAFLQDGLAVRFTIVRFVDLAGFCPGTKVEIGSIEPA